MRSHVWEFVGLARFWSGVKFERSGSAGIPPDRAGPGLARGETTSEGFLGSREFHAVGFSSPSGTPGSSRIADSTG